MAEGAAAVKEAKSNSPDPAFDWRKVAYDVLVSRAMDRLEEERLVPG